MTSISPAVRAALLAPCVLLAVVSNAPAQEKRVRIPAAEQPVVTRFERDIARRHDKGAMFHAEVGLGYGSGPGLGAAGGIGLGWLPWENTALGVEAWGMWGAPGGLGGVGPGLTYYFPQSALHLRSAAGVVAQSLDGKPMDLSLGGSLALGITPYITPDASLGLGMMVAGQLVDLDGNGASGAGFMMGLSLSWTLN